MIFEVKKIIHIFTNVTFLSKVWYCNEYFRSRDYFGLCK